LYADHIFSLFNNTSCNQDHKFFYRKLKDLQKRCILVAGQDSGKIRCAFL